MTSSDGRPNTLSPHPLSPESDGPAFDELTAAFLADELAARPIVATGLGVTEHDERLPDLSDTGFADRHRAEDRWTDRFSAWRDAERDRALDTEQRIDRDLVLMTLAGRRVLRDWAGWRRDPDVYSWPALYGVFVLFLHRLRPEPELAAAAAARLRGVPGLVAAGVANLDPDLAPTLLVRRALGQVRAGAAWVRDAAAQVGDARLRPDVAEAGAVAGAALDAFARHLEALAERAHGSHAIGAERYSALLRDAEGLAYDAAGLRARGAAAHDALVEDLRRRTQDLAGHDDWRAYVAELDTIAPDSPEHMLASYAAATTRARAFCAERGLVSFADGERCRVEPSAPFTRSMIAVAHYVEPPPFAAARVAPVGHFFVPYPPDGASADEVRQRLATNSLPAIPSIAAHETYPGHHWHLSWVAATNPRPLRALLGTPFFTEGWALYAEQMMSEQGFFADPREALCQVDARLLRAARVVVDVGLHTGEMSVADAASVMTTKASLSPETARVEVARYCAAPTQAAAYLVGALEIERMRDAFVGGGRGSLREFHDRLAGCGQLPLGLARRALDG